MLELNTNNSQKRNDVSKDKNWTEKEWKSLTTERTHSIKTPSVGWYAMGIIIVVVVVGRCASMSMEKSSPQYSIFIITKRLWQEQTSVCVKIGTKIWWK